MEDVFSSSPMKKAIDFASVVSVLEAWKREELGLMDDLRLGCLIGMNMVDNQKKRILSPQVDNGSTGFKRTATIDRWLICARPSLCISALRSRKSSLS